MRLAQTSTWGLLIASVAVFATEHFHTTFAQDAAPEVLAEFEFVVTKPPILWGIAEVNPDGTLELVPILGRPPTPAEKLSKGYYLGIAPSPSKRIEESRLVLIRVEEIDDERISARVGCDAAKEIFKGNIIGLFRPGNVAANELIKLPLISHVKGGKPPVDGGASGDASSEHERLLKAQANMKELAIALHNYANANGSFPPTYLVGPDGMPWHSWRVLILPFLENGSELYKKYKLDEPWDSANNLKLLDEKPALYSKPSENDRSQYTHVAAITGQGVLFSAEGADVEGGKFACDSGRRINEVLDGLSNTLMLGPVSDEAKLPWTKPEDLVFSDPLPKLGTPGSFALDYIRDGEKVGPFLIADGTVILLSESMDPQLYRNLLTINGGEPIDRSGFMQLNARPQKTSELPISTLIFVREGDRTTAYLDEQWAR